MPYINKFAGQELTTENVNQAFRYIPATGMLYRILSKGKLKWCNHPNNGDDHNITSFNGKSYQSTHIIWFIMTGSWPTLYVEHRDRNKKNDRWDNLREATQSQNMANVGVSKRSKSGVKGVFWDQQRACWAVYITKNYKTHFIGRYFTIEEAKIAHKNKHEEMFGEFSHT